MAYQDTYEVTCPYCFETIPLDFDFSEGNDQLFEIDCPVCCRPVDVNVHHASQEIVAEARREKD